MDTRTERWRSRRRRHEFVVTNLTVAARRVLADRSEFTLGPEAERVWEEINRRPARDLLDSQLEGSEGEAHAVSTARYVLGLIDSADPNPVGSGSRRDHPR